MKNLKSLSLLSIVVLAVALVLSPPILAQPSSASSALHDLFAREWAFRLKEDPLQATNVGQPTANDKLPSVSAADHERRAKVLGGFVDELAGIDRGALSPADQVSAEMFRVQLRERIEEVDLRAYEIPLTSDTGFHIAFAGLPRGVPLATTRDYENYLARLRAWPKYVRQQIANMREGLERGFTLPRVVLEGYEVTIASHVVSDPEKSVFYPPFRKFASTIPAADQDRLRAAGKAAILEGAVAGYKTFLDFMTREYIPGARQSIGASELPGGAAYYAQRVRHFTTLDLTPREIHQIGLREVARIRGEMQTILEELNFEGDFSAFLEFLRTDPRFYAKTPEELLMRASFIAKKMDAQLPALFKTLPRLPYGVAPVPDHLAPKYTGGRYVGAAQGSTQPGYYWVNTYALESRPLYILESLTLHEAVPGHHLQISLAGELEDLPNFRRHDYISAFGEGWGLYSEWLGLEAGFYTDPYSNFGRLTYEMWRACRLVVDTGMHAMGWPRQKAFDFLASNTALSLHEVGTEIDRYISWPGQALAYKIGEIKIKELRREAEKTLGEEFDIREFHDAVLLNGSVPLPVLEQLVRRYIENP